MHILHLFSSGLLLAILLGGTAWADAEGNTLSFFSAKPVTLGVAEDGKPAGKRIPALGRPFSLGQLYDDTRNLIKSRKLWNSTMLSKVETVQDVATRTKTA